MSQTIIDPSTGLAYVEDATLGGQAQSPDLASASQPQAQANAPVVEPATNTPAVNSQEPSATPSAPVSPAPVQPGVQNEAQAQPPAQAPPTAPVSQPAPQVGPTAAAPVTAQPVAQPQATETAQATPAPAAPATPAVPDQGEILRSLQDWKTEGQEETQRHWQSVADRDVAAANAKAEVGATQFTQLRDEMRSFKAEGLTEEQQVELRKVYEQDDRSAALEQWSSDLSEYHLGLSARGMLLDYAAFGVNEEFLNQFTTPEEMEAACLEVKNVYVNKQLEKASQASATAAPAVPVAQPPTPAVAQPVAQAPVAPVAQVPQAAPPAPAAPPLANVPGGVAAATDVGSTGAPNQRQWNPGKGPSALADNLKASPWVTPTR